MHKKQSWLAWWMVLGVFMVFPQAQEPVTEAKLQGAWKLVSMTMEGKDTPATGYMLFQGDRYAFVTNTQRPSLTRETGRKDIPELDDAEKNLFIEAFRSMTAAAGPFSIEGNEITYVMEVVRTPYLQGRTEKRKSWFEGQRLTQDFEGGGRPRVMIWERVTPGDSSGRP